MQKSENSSSNEIKLKGASFLATHAEISALAVQTDECYDLICNKALFSFEYMPPSLALVVPNLLQEYHDDFTKEVPPADGGDDHTSSLVTPSGRLRCK